MSSISVGELKTILEEVPEDWEVVMKIRHNYDISKEDGIGGWTAYINGVERAMDAREVRLRN